MYARVNLSYVDDIDVFPIIETFRYALPEIEGYLNGQVRLPKNLIFEFEYSLSFTEFEGLIRKAVGSYKNQIYEVAVDTEGNNTLTLLKPNDLEQLGIFICNFCGAVSSSEEEKYIHERAHYFF